ncbi:hypothetical protein F3Y22_tig00113145pilonHSYRG00169 [Hibiscus syriacus]|uniref:Uncharacterized protein n=1 Tax=Hibiscus syriacus TaxID=106335 RepID=A0A6A2Y0A9_HIBSY|nr:hypothetical protein F3Y22_tig00113145pilonHSYRG00169 [Hibiscus syriacus]
MSEKCFLRGTLGSGIKTLAGSVTASNTLYNFSIDCPYGPKGTPLRWAPKLQLGRVRRLGRGRGRVTRFADPVDEMHLDPPPPEDNSVPINPIDLPLPLTLIANGVGTFGGPTGRALTKVEDWLYATENAHTWWESVVNSVQADLLTWDFFRKQFRSHFMGERYLVQRRHLVPTERDKCQNFSHGLRYEMRHQVVTHQDEVFDVVVGRAKDTKEVEASTPDRDRVDRDWSRRSSGQSKPHECSDKRILIDAHQRSHYGLKFTSPPFTPAQTPSCSHASVQTPARNHNQSRTSRSISRVDTREQSQSRGPTVSEARRMPLYMSLIVLELGDLLTVRLLDLVSLDPLVCERLGSHSFEEPCEADARSGMNTLVGSVAAGNSLYWFNTDCPYGPEGNPLKWAPKLWLGLVCTYNVAGTTLTTAIKAGYRHIDCASLYANEKEV